MHSAIGLAHVQQQIAEKKRLDLEIMNRQRMMLRQMMGLDTPDPAAMAIAAPMATAGGVATTTTTNVVEDKKETTVLMLVNMFKEEDIKEEAEYVDIKDDVKCECQSFGNLLEVV